jgi:hypothetical protein
MIDKEIPYIRAVTDALLTGTGVYVGEQRNSLLTSGAWDATRWDACVASGITGSIAQPDPREMQARHHAELSAARQAGAQAERERILALWQKLKPARLWFDEQRGAMGMWERMVAAINEPQE